MIFSIVLLGPLDY